MQNQVLPDFDYYICEYLNDCRLRQLRPKTMNSYEQTLRLFERWTRDVEKITGPEKVTERIIKRYILDVQDRGKYSFYANEDKRETNCPDRRRDYRQPVGTTTINNYIRNLRAFFNWYAAAYSIQINPMSKIKQIKIERKPREYLEDHEVKKLLDCFDKSYYSECRDCMIVMLILDTGMRVGECLSTTISQIDLHEHTIFIPADIAKGRKARNVFFSSKTSHALRRWLQFKDRYVESDYLFPIKATGLPVQISSFETNFKNYLKRCNIKKEISPHVLRNNFAKRCLMAGMDIYTLSRILGHSSVTVTEKAYLDLDDSDIRRRYQHFSPLENMR